MTESVFVDSNLTRSEKYKALFPQLKAIVEAEPDLIANLANVSAVLKEVFGFFWVGFYRRINEELVLGPFQGSLACTRIPLNKGVCGACAREMKTLIVPNVDEFPGHIACSSLSRSEIVVPLAHQNRVELVLDVDSVKLTDFDETDASGLQKIMSLLKTQHY